MIGCCPSAHAYIQQYSWQKVHLHNPTIIPFTPLDAIIARSDGSPVLLAKEPTFLRKSISPNGPVSIILRIFTSFCGRIQVTVVANYVSQANMAVFLARRVSQKGRSGGIDPPGRTTTFLRPWRFSLQSVTETSYREIESRGNQMN